MSLHGPEAPDLAALNGSLVLNMGSITPSTLTSYLTALQAYNARGGPVVFDPVGAGATQLRRDAVRTLMAGGYFDVIKGNEGEIKTVAGQHEGPQKGVDSGPSTWSATDKARLVKRLAARERNVVVLTGPTDFLSDGDRTFAIANGHPYLARVTGAGCTLGTTVASFLAVHREDKFLATLAAMLLYEIAAERAAKRDDVRGPGTFVAAFLDELYAIATEDGTGWLEGAKVTEVDI